MDGAEQRAYTQRVREFTLANCKTFGIKRIPSGDAWQIFRDGGYDNLCARLGVNNNVGDNYHDCNIGGGQYLNACVRFEVLTGQSCVGNTYRPIYYHEGVEYTLSEELIQQLQNAAYQTVADMSAGK